MPCPNAPDALTNAPMRCCSNALLHCALLHQRTNAPGARRRRCAGASSRARADGLLLLGNTFSGGSKGVAAGVDGLNILAQQASVGLIEAAAAVNRLFARTCATTR